MQAQAELGFIVVQIDGMGTANRSKAFHDVAWKNLGDAGFPDRILWHQAVAARVPVLRHLARRHLRRLRGRAERARRPALPPRILPRGRLVRRLPRQPHGQDLVERAVDGLAGRAALRGVVQRGQRAPAAGQAAARVGELDTNVDPASTMQVVDALIRADKDFDLLVVPGGGHGGTPRARSARTPSAPRPAGRATRPRTASSPAGTPSAQRRWCAAVER
jgi:hypothetical protein